jgi:hypothetical protein
MLRQLSDPKLSEDICIIKIPLTVHQGMSVYATVFLTMSSHDIHNIADMIP